MIYLQVTFLQAYAASFLPKQILLKFNIIKCNTDGFEITIKFTLCCIQSRKNVIINMLIAFTYTCLFMRSVV
jgi:hypothetical protein